jgi:hypothetical protein
VCRLDGQRARVDLAGEVPATPAEEEPGQQCQQDEEEARMRRGDGRRRRGLGAAPLLVSCSTALVLMVQFTPCRAFRA